MAVGMKMTSFWDIAPCSLIEDDIIRVMMVIILIPEGYLSSSQI
jgi:hypothetical protein